MTQAVKSSPLFHRDTLVSDCRKRVESTCWRVLYSSSASPRAKEQAKAMLDDAGRIATQIADAVSPEPSYRPGIHENALVALIKKHAPRLGGDDGE